ncbi:MAG: RNA 3'-terminal phosphate cyclase [Burkholderiales bacterium]
MLEIDGSHGEGGGQLLRTAVALAALTGSAIRCHSIRVRRDKPGLAPQHLAAVHAVAELCGARVDGLTVRSLEITFAPRGVRGGEFAFDVGTAGSVTLVLQALLPVMVAAGQDFRVRVSGGTDVRGAPPLDYLREVLLPLVARMGVRAQLVTRCRGYYPRGGGTVEISVAAGTLRPLRLATPGRVLRIDGLAHVAHLPAHVAERMRAAALEQLGPREAPVRCATAVLGEAEALGQGGAVVMWAQCEHTVLGAGRVAQRGVRAEMLGEAAGRELAADLAARATVDVHAADQILVYLALAGGVSSFTTRALSSHATTAMWLIEQFLPARFTAAPHDVLTRVAVAPR